ncbi:hypothetical protein GCM10010109_63570 [Actinoplanes campanulatus]|nr:hypothetical protein GCM10010109_63570 [Actinoplanes campanulatus]GID40808.1 hypothetical protein Aca09nite_73140 [Actinoplanes campanulatus]
MDRTAAVGSSPDSAGAGAGEERTASGLPLRRPKKPPLEPEGEPVSWFGGESDTGSLSSPVAAPPPESAPSEPSPRSVSSPPAFGPASPAGPGRTSFGFSDGPIGRSRTGRAPGEGDAGGDGEPSRHPKPAGGSMGALAAASGALPVTDELPARRRRNRSDVPSEELPVVRTTGNPAPSFPEPPAAEPSAFAEPPAWGPIGSPAGETFWSGARDQRPNEPAVWSETPASSASAPPAVRPRPRQSRLVTAGMTMLGVVALAVVAFTGVVYYTGDDSQISDMLQLGDDQRVVTGPLESRTIATFEMLAATDRVRLTIADLGTDMYRISAPDNAGIRPNAEFRDDRLRVDVARDETGTGGEVEVVLSAKVRWTIRFSGYSAERIVDLSEGRIRGIEIVGGTRRAELTLADASGTVPMKITGGIEELILRAPSGSPVRVKVGGGAGTVTAGSKTLRNVAPGSTLTPKDWTSGNRYDVDAVAPVTLLTVETA